MEKWRQTSLVVLGRFSVKLPSVYNFLIQGIFFRGYRLGWVVFQSRKPQCVCMCDDPWERGLHAASQDVQRPRLKYQPRLRNCSLICFIYNVHT